MEVFSAKGNSLDTIVTVCSHQVRSDVSAWCDSKQSECKNYVFYVNLHFACFYVDC